MPEIQEKKPLVSIIVRTKDRPQLLKRALQSISAQTYRPIEVVLVNDGGCDLDVQELKAILGDVSLNYQRLEKNTGRAHAGNVGIENARGEYIGFLDDDDEFYPEHILTLISFLRQSSYKVAYTDSLMVFKESDPKTAELRKDLIFSEDFDHDRLILENYIPFICLLFKRNALINSGGFDSSFNLYEDWDLLIRIGENHPFYHIKTITADYNQWSDSQIAFKSSQEKTKEATLMLYEKHKTKIPVKDIFDLIEEKNSRDAIIAEKNKYIRVLEDEKNNLEGALRERESCIQNIEAGRGWRLLRRYYKFRDWFLVRSGKHKHSG